jgi:hypothetical protein
MGNVFGTPTLDNIYNQALIRFSDRETVEIN